MSLYASVRRAGQAREGWLGALRALWRDLHAEYLSRGWRRDLVRLEATETLLAATERQAVDREC